MNTKTMLSRENFLEVLLGTIAAYYRQVHGAEVTLSLKKQKGAKPLYLYYKPLFVSAFPLGKGAKEFLYSEYNIRGSILKYLIGKLGVFVITNSFGIGAAKRIYISGAEGVNTRLFISPCNRTVRFYDFEADTVDCILKEGYKPLFLNNQLDFRMNCRYDFVPKVLKRGPNWYSERIMHGHALARVRDIPTRLESFWQLESSIKQLAEDTRENLPGQAYFAGLKQQVLSLCAQLLEQSDPQGEQVARCLETMQTRMAGLEMTIPTCISHGDLQEGNIWASRDGRVLIYDWETCGRRSVWYDPITLHYSLHNRGPGYNLPGLLKTDTQWLMNDPQKAYTPRQLEFVCSIVLTEDILFQLQEAMQLAGGYSQKRAKEVLKTFVETVKECSDDAEA